MLKKLEKGLVKIINGIFGKNNLIMKRITLSLFVALAIISCKENSSEALFVEKEATPATESIQIEPQSEVTSTENPAIEVKMEEPQTTSSTTQVQKFNVEQPQKPAQQTGVTAAGFEGKPNPAHGQPGHRCDIKVGDPLPFNNASSTTTATPVKAATPQPQPTVNATPSVIQQQPQQPATTGVTAPGFSGKPNPAHGQPGHRCDIKVGEILP